MHKHENIGLQLESIHIYERKQFSSFLLKTKASLQNTSEMYIYK